MCHKLKPRNLRQQSQKEIRKMRLQLIYSLFILIWSLSILPLGLASKRDFTDIAVTNNTGFKVSVLLEKNIKSINHEFQESFALYVHELEPTRLLWSCKVRNFPSYAHVSPDGKRVVIIDGTDIDIYEAPGEYRQTIQAESLVTEPERKQYFIQSTVGTFYLNQALLYFLDNQIFVVRFGWGKRVALDCIRGVAVKLDAKSAEAARIMETKLSNTFLMYNLSQDSFDKEEVSKEMIFDQIRGIRQAALLGNKDSVNRLKQLLHNDIVTSIPPKTFGIARAAKWALRYLKQPYDDVFDLQIPIDDVEEILDSISENANKSVKIIDSESENRQKRLTECFPLINKGMKKNEVIFFLGYPDTLLRESSSGEYIVYWYYWKKKTGRSYRITIQEDEKVYQTDADIADPTPLPWQLSIWD